jgi:hypothetical protein
MKKSNGVRNTITKTYFNIKKIEVFKSTDQEDWKVMFNSKISSFYN